MKHTVDITEANVYVGTYRKYNSGSLFGKWLKLSDYSNIEEFYSACHILHKDEHDPEFMFQDYENIPDGLIGECWISNNIFEVMQALENMTDSEPFLVWCNNGGHNLSTDDMDDLIISFNSDYIGQYDREEDFARELIEQRGDLTDFAKQYFDYKAYANDLFCGDYWMDSGYVFIIS